VLSAIKAQITELIKNPVIIKDELARTKTQLEAEFVFEQDRLSTQSYYLGMLATVGLGIETMFSYVDKMNAAGFLISSVICALIADSTVSLSIPFAGIKLRVNKVLYLSYSL
jgi:hypothetical protein